MNESPDAAEGKAYRQSPNGPDLIDSPNGRARRVVAPVAILAGLAALGLAALIELRHWHGGRWEAPALAAAGVVLALLGAVAFTGFGRSKSSYRFDSSSSRALSTLGRMHDKS